MLCLIWLLMSLLSVNSYNIDADKAVVFKMPKSERMSFFGYSVGLKLNSTGNDSWLAAVGYIGVLMIFGDRVERMVVVGAPRANDSTKWNEPGAVYNCPLVGPCQRLHLLKDRKRSEGLHRGEIYNDNSFIGVSMDTDLANGFVVCGQKITYISKMYKLQDFLSIGGCFESYGGVWLHPFNKANESFLFQKIEGKAADLLVHGLAGISVSLLTSPGIWPNSSLFFGAPNVDRSTGSVTSYQFKSKQTQVMKAAKRDEGFWRAAYIGYSVATMVVQKEPMILLGAPRSHDLHGAAILIPNKVLTRTKEFLADVDLKEVKFTFKQDESNYFASYFGASVAGNDLNNDGNDDIVIGAPMFSDAEEMERGAVTIFMFRKLKSSAIDYEANVREVGANSRSRFGACVAIPGDFDQDGYNDVFVGAPGEGDHGAVYIFYFNGWHTWRKQIIYASAFSPQVLLSGFGISVSRAADVDANGYPDVAVGASETDAAVILRARPIVQVSSTINCVNEIDRNATDFSLTICSQCTCNKTTTLCDIDTEIIADSEKGQRTKRAFIDDYGTNTINFTFSRVSTNSNGSCRHFTVQVRPVSDSVVTNDWKPIVIRVRTKLAKMRKTKDVKVVWNETGSMGNIDVVSLKVSESQKKVWFNGDCGKDGECHVHFKSSCATNIHEPLIVGKKVQAHFQVNITNLGEPSRETNLTFTMEGISGENVASSPNCMCKSYQCSCNLGYRPNSTQISTTFSLHLDAWQTSKLTGVTLSSKLSTSGNQSDPDGMICQRQIPLISDARVSLIYSPMTSIAVDQSALNFIVVHTFEFRKIGHSPVLLRNLTAHVPVLICGFPIAHVSEADTLQIASVVESAPCMQQLQRKLVGRTLQIECGNNDVLCARSVLASGEVLKLNITLHADIFEKFLEVDVINFISNGTAHALLPFDREGKYTANCITYITRRSIAGKGETSVWIISLIVASMILAFIVPVLVKVGFFRRKTKERMDALKAEDFIRERFSMYESFPLPDNFEKLNGSRSVSVTTLNDVGTD